jgi:Trk-type K+ transport system membrane component
LPSPILSSPLYSGSFINYLQAYTIVLAILIAMIATTVAFFTFFRLRAHWEDNFIKRTACALVLAIAVCGQYRSVVSKSEDSKTAARNEIETIG